MPQSTFRSHTLLIRSVILTAGLGLSTVSLTILAGANAFGQSDEPAAVADAAGNVVEAADADPPSGALTIENAQTSLMKNAFIAVPLSGVVSSVDVSEGDRVEKGALLIRLRSDLAEKEWGTAKAALDAARLESDNDVNLRFARRTLEVREHEMKLSEMANRAYSGAVSNMELDEIRLKVDQATLAIEQAQLDLMIASAAAVEKEAAVSIAQTKLDRHNVLTSVDGTVAQIDIEPGEWVEAGKPIVRIISLDPIRIECFVDGRKHGRELVGHAVDFVPSGAKDGDSLRGRVAFVSRELHPVTGQVRLWATVENPGGKIGSGATGKLVID